MTYNELLSEIHKETIFFFDNILTSKELQEEYDLETLINNEYIHNVIKNFKESKNAFIIKPFYEKDYMTVQRSLIIKRDSSGFITVNLNGTNTEPSIIEPFRFVSIIKQHIEDEEIKKETYASKENTAEKVEDFSL